MPDLPTSLMEPAQRLTAVEGAVLSLRRGMPAFIGGESGPALALLATETADQDGLACLRRAGSGPVRLLLSQDRASAVLPESILQGGGFQGRVIQGGIVALQADELSLDEMRALADPTHQPLGADWAPRLGAVPEDADAALALAVLARLLPALLCAAAPGRRGPPVFDVLQHAALSASLLSRVSEATVPLEDAADCRLIAFRASNTGAEHYAVLIGRPEDAAAPLVRVHSECFTGDLLGSLRCDCGPQLRGAIRRMAAEGAGALLYLAQEGRGIGLANKVRAYALQDRGLDTLDANRALGFKADERDFQVAASMLRQLGLRRIRLLTNNPDKVAALTSHGVTVIGRESLLFAANGVNDRYLHTKATRFGHLPE